MRKSLPNKTCPICNLSFDWRKKWKKNWDEVRYCSQACRSKRYQLKKGLNLLNNIFNFENTYMNLPDEFHSYVKPRKVISPKLAIFNDDLCTELGFNFSIT